MQTDTKTFTYGTNMPGYMPDGEVRDCESLEQAVECLIGEVDEDIVSREEHIFYNAGMPREDKVRLEEEISMLRVLQQDMKTWTEPRTSICAGRAYWIHAS